MSLFENNLKVISTAGIFCMFLASWGPLKVAGAADILNSFGFEDYVLNSSLEGQTQGTNIWLQSNLGEDTSTATVQDAVVESGSKAVRVERGPHSNSRWAVSYRGHNYPDYRYIVVEWDMYVSGTGASSVFGPFMGVDTYDDILTPRVLGSLGVDATTGDVIYQETGTGYLRESGLRVSFDQWYQYQIRLDFMADEYSIFVDDLSTPLLTESFVDGPSDTFTDADIAALAASSDVGSQEQSAVAYYDNFLIREILPGDFDMNGTVDETDLADWQAAYGNSAEGDANYDGLSDGSDFLLWQRSYRESIANPLATPEPNSLVLMFFSAVSGSRWSSRRSC